AQLAAAPDARCAHAGELPKSVGRNERFLNLRRLVLLGLMGSFIGFVGCDPNVAPRVRNEAEVNINVESTGDAIASVFVSPRSMARLRHLGAELAATDPFRSGRGATFRINGNDGGSPFLDVTWAGVFRPGRRPTFSFDSGPLWLALSKRSLT